jgi:hypothetical protein
MEQVGIEESCRTLEVVVREDATEEGLGVSDAGWERMDLRSFSRTFWVVSRGLTGLSRTLFCAASTMANAWRRCESARTNHDAKPR